MRQILLIIVFFLLCTRASAQRYKFWVFPEMGYSYQRVHTFMGGIKIGIIDDSLLLRPTNYSLVLRADLTKREHTFYLSPAFGVRGCNYIKSAPFAITYGIYGTEFHSGDKRDWVLTPEIGFSYVRCLNITYGYNFPVNGRDIPFYSGHKISLRAWF